MAFISLGKQDLLRMVACLLLGSLLGAALATVMGGVQVDQLLYENRELTQRLEEEQMRMKQFEKVYSWTPVVRKVTLELSSNAEKHTKQELSTQIRTLLIGLIGLNIQQIDHTILREILHNRVIPVGDDTYLLQVETIIIDDELAFFVKATPRPKKSLEDEA
jgi:hypothetical protein